MEFWKKYNAILTAVAKSLKLWWDIYKVRLVIKNVTAPMCCIPFAFKTLALHLALVHVCETSLLEYGRHPFEHIHMFVTVWPAQGLDCTICEFIFSWIYYADEMKANPRTDIHQIEKSYMYFWNTLAVFGKLRNSIPLTSTTYVMASTSI